MESIQPHGIRPWDQRIPAVIEPDRTKATELAAQSQGIRIATSASVRGGMVGMGGAIVDARPGADPQAATSSFILRPRTEQNLYTAELAAMAAALTSLLPCRLAGQITIITSSQAAIQAINRPKGQSGQSSIAQIYNVTREFRQRGCQVSLVWSPMASNELGEKAKRAARKATAEGKVPHNPFYQARSTVTNVTIAAQRKGKRLPEKVGAHSKKVDTALPGKHTKKLYNDLSWREATVLAQLRTGMVRLNAYLHQIGAAESDT